MITNDYWIYNNNGKEIPEGDGFIAKCDVCSIEKEKVVVIGNNQWPDYDVSSMMVCKDCIVKINNDERWS